MTGQGPADPPRPLRDPRRAPDARGPTVTIAVGPGELIDRITRLELALEEAGDPAARAGLAERLGALVAARDAALPADARLDALSAELAEVNADRAALARDLAAAEARGDFGPAFVALARALGALGDRRAALRRAIDLHLGARFPEPERPRRY